MNKIDAVLLKEILAFRCCAIENCAHTTKTSER